MATPAPPSVLKPYERSARRDLRYWAMLLVGLGFAWAGSTIDPATNCDSSGECAPWLVPIAKWIGIGFSMSALGMLWVNPRRGSRIAPETGELTWWKNSVSSGGDKGQIHPERIGRIRIVSQSDGDDEVHLYDLDGQRQPHFDCEVIPWPYERWARALGAAWPHIVVETDD